MTERQNRDIHTSVMLTPATSELLEQAKSKRRGVSASKSAVINDILTYFFAVYGTDIDQTVNVVTKTSCIPTTAVYLGFPGDDAGGAS